MGFFVKKSQKNKTEPYNPYANSNNNTPSTAMPNTGFANALNPGAAPPQVYVPPGSFGASAPPASMDYNNSHAAAAVPLTTPHSSLPASGGGGQPPKKYVKINGVMKLNPEYKRWKDAQQGGAGVAPGTANTVSPIALPVVSNMDDHAQLNQDLGQDVPLAESTNATIEMMQEPEISLGMCVFLLDVSSQWS